MHKRKTLCFIGIQKPSSPSVWPTVTQSYLRFDSVPTRAFRNQNPLTHSIVTKIRFPIDFARLFNFIFMLGIFIHLRPIESGQEVAILSNAMPFVDSLVLQSLFPI
jgi:hypothetical protein